ncbi:hypothetical protein X777_05410 [Ooceraea biroi]|uniref:Uncharacterized protein n=1 Tax=Ooceraea biroi TaxID=2015173 RepID=A0A026WFS8_OOCBI|nr:hypothetical protein X777_05410 [Ooceraea biroi]
MYSVHYDTWRPLQVDWIAQRLTGFVRAMLIQSNESRCPKVSLMSQAKSRRDLRV